MSASKRSNYFSKSNLMLGLNCAKALHLAVHQPKLKAKPDAAQQQVFDQGNEVGARAREYFDQEGVLIQAKPWEYPLSLSSTQRAIGSGAQTVYEAAFSDGALYSRVDILHRKGGDWHLIEVKASNSVKDEHIRDVAIQALTLKRAGFAVASYSVMHLNRACVFPDLSELFVIQEVTSEVNEVLSEVEARVDALIRFAGGSEPEMPLGRRCDEPYECPFKAHCWAAIPAYSVFELPRMDADLAGRLVSEGCLEIVQLNPEDFPENELSRRAIAVTRSGERFVDEEGIRAAVGGWSYPLHFLDFETVMPAIPRYDGTRPYSQVPYQFSCHVLAGENEELAHDEYLYLDTGDPRGPLVDALTKSIGPKGAVVSYYAKFEAARLKELADAFPQHKAALESIIDRLVDPLPVVRDFVYDREFRGSFSIKKVAPALLGGEFRYDDKAVSDGQMAGVLADRCLRGLAPSRDVPGIRKMLIEYCRQDTLAMVRLYEWLRAQAR